MPVGTRDSQSDLAIILYFPSYTNNELHTFVTFQDASPNVRIYDVLIKLLITASMKLRLRYAFCLRLSNLSISEYIFSKPHLPVSRYTSYIFTKKTVLSFFCSQARA